MIISDEQKFAFIHIPKNAGSNIRNQIKSFDSYNGRFSSICDHPVLGSVHLAHLTIDQIRNVFPEVYDKLCMYMSIAIVRDPSERFFSALNQHLREFHGMRQSEINDRILVDLAFELLEKLKEIDSRRVVEFCHFTRQVEFVQDDNGFRAKRIFPFEEMQSAMAFVLEHFQMEVQADENAREYNATIQARSPLVRMGVQALRPVAAVFPTKFQDAVRRMFLATGLYSQGNASTASRALANEELKALLYERYSEDFKLYELVKASSV